MFATADTPTATLSYFLDYVNLNPPFIAQEGCSSQSLGHLVFVTPALGDVRVFATTDTARISGAALAPAFDAWTQETLSAIAAHRNLPTGWDNKCATVPTEESLDTAEVLTQAFAFAPMTRRPIFSIDSEGNPSFSSYNSELYLHLTIDRLGMVSWYSVKDGEERLIDDVKIDGLNLEVLASKILMTV